MSEHTAVSPSSSSASRPLLLGLGAALLFGASTPAAKALLGTLHPFSLAGLLYLGASLGVLPWALRGLPSARRLHRKNLYRLGGAVLFGGIAGPLLLLSGLALAPASSVALWLGMETPATLVLGLLLFHEHVDRRSLLAAALITAAGVMIASPSSFSALVPAVLVVLACFAWGLDNQLTALIDGFTPSQSTLVKGLVAGTFNLGLGFALEGGVSASRFVLYALLVGALSYGASLVLYVAAAQQLGATRSQMLFATSPFWGLFLAWVTLGESILPAQVAAGSVMAFAIAVMHRERHAHSHAHEAQRHTHWHRHNDEHHDHVHESPPPKRGHTHEHTHEAVTHAHAHRPDLHHRHEH